MIDNPLLNQFKTPFNSVPFNDINLEHFIPAIRESVKIIRQALASMPKDGDVHQSLPKKIRPPKGSVYARTETPRGDLGYYIESDGTNIPYRLKMRSPAFTSLSVLDEIGSGWLLSDVLAILGSLDIVLGEIDR